MHSLEIEENIVKKWQSVIDTMAELIQVPAGLIMRISGSDIEVFVSSRTKDNPYNVGDKEYLIGSGLYCETVIRTKDKLIIPDATKDENWKDNPDIELGMISYMGYPIILPTGDVFGTICVLDRKANCYSEVYERLVSQFKELIESHISLFYKNNEISHANKELAARIAEIKTLRGLIPICSFCKNIRDDKGYWQVLEKYIQEHSEAKFSHGVCLDCLKKHYPEVYEQNKAKYEGSRHA
ncbi:GAF domain-containing protein [Desulfobacterales bacterium HSG2]|nr:GAF domain-containing protein [Desulfobacterales bacterium HSG2]